MRVLVVGGSIDPKLGGSVEAARLIALGLAAEGCHPEILSADRSLPEWRENWPFPMHECGPAPTIFRFTPKLIPWLRRNARNYDAVIVNGVWTWVGIAVRRGLAGTSVPYFTFTHGMLDPWFKKRFPGKHLKKSVFWRLFELPNLAAARAVLFTCEHERNSALSWPAIAELPWFIAPLGIAGVPPGRERQIQAWQEAYPNLVNQRYLLFLGRLAPQKGPELLLEAFARLAPQTPPVHLVMAGPGSAAERAALQAIAVPVADRVHWTGHLDGDLKWGAFQCADAFVLTSRHENFGVSVAEALAARIPILISDRVAIYREILAAGAGFVESDDVEGATRLLRRWFTTPASTRLAMAASAYQCFLNHFEYRSAVRALIGILRQCGVCEREPAHPVRSGR